MKKAKIFFLLIAIAIDASSQVQFVNANIPSSIQMYEKYEITVGINNLPSISQSFNPYDPSHIDFYAEFWSPSGKYFKQNGFYFQSVNQTTTSSGHAYPCDLEENLSLGIIKNWKIRFAANETGTWQFRLTVITNTAGTTHYPSSTSTTSFNVTSALTDNHGFINKANSRYLKFSDNTPYYPIGINYPMPTYSGLCGTTEVKKVMNDMADAGINYFRTFLGHYDGLGISGNSSLEPKNYLRFMNQKRAWQIDEMMNHARLKGIFIQFCLNVHEVMGDGYWCLWSHVNPYNSDCFYPPQSPDSPISGTISPKDFFSNADAIQVTKNIARYYVARWGYSVNLMSFELFNETDKLPDVNSNTQMSQYCGDLNWLDPFTQSYQDDLNLGITNWHATMKTYFDQIDPYDHPVSTSYAYLGHPTMMDVFSDMDYTQLHRYFDYRQGSPGTYQDALYLDQMSYLHIPFVDKPYFIGEGYYFSSLADWHDAYAFDPHFYDLHNSLWSSLMNGSMGVFSSWEYTFHQGGQNANDNFIGISEYLKTLPQLTERFKPYRSTAVGNNGGLRLFHLENENKDEIYGWVQDNHFTMNYLLYANNNLPDIDFNFGPYADYLLNFNPTYRPPLSSTVNYNLNFSVDKVGLYDVTFYNTETGQVESVLQPIQSSNGTIVVPISLSLLDGKFADIAFTIKYRCSSIWNVGVLSATAPQNNRLNTPTVYYNQSIFSIGTDNKIHQIYWTGYYWQDETMPITYTSLARYDSDITKDNLGNIYFIGDDNRIHRVYWSAGQWQESPLNISSPQNVKMNSSIASDGVGNVYFISLTDNKVHRMKKVGTSWQEETLLPSQSIVMLNTDLECDNLGRVYFFSNSDYKLHFLYLNNGVWIDQALNPAHPSTVRKQFVLGSGFICKSSIAIDQTNNVFFVGSDNRIHEFYFSNGVWIETTLSPSAPQNVRNNSIDNRNSLVADNYNIYFIASDNSVHHYYWNQQWYETTTYSNSGILKNVNSGLAIDISNSYVFYNATDSRIWANFWGCTDLFIGRQFETSEDSMPNVNTLFFEIYPNPSDGKFKIDPKGLTIDEVFVYDIFGKEILSFKYTSADVDLTNVSKGIYIIKVHLENGLTSSKKIIIQ